MDKKYISISAFAKIHNISKSAVYALLELEENQQYLQISNGRKLVSVDLPIDADKKTQSFQEMRADAVSRTEETASAQNEIIYLRKTIEDLREDIRRAQETIQEKDRIISENTQTITLLLERQQELTEKALQVATQAQILQALPQKKKGFFARLLGSRKDEE